MSVHAYDRRTQPRAKWWLLVAALHRMPLITETLVTTTCDEH